MMISNVFCHIFYNDMSTVFKYHVKKNALITVSFETVSSATGKHNVMFFSLFYLLLSLFVLGKNSRHVKITLVQV